MSDDSVLPKHDPCVWCGAPVLIDWEAFDTGEWVSPRCEQHKRKARTKPEFEERYRLLARQAEDVTGGSEMLHVLEDQLHEDALEAIADGDPDPADIASLVLQTRLLTFDRWYA